jgi:hypothetical protein
MNRRYAKTRNEAAAPLLPDRIARSIAGAPYAHLVVGAEADRLQVLPEIASLHTRRELLTLEGVGPAAVRRLEAWLAHHERRLRNPSERLDTVICNFSFHLNQARRPLRRAARGFERAHR